MAGASGHVPGRNPSGLLGGMAQRRRHWVNGDGSAVTNDMTVVLHNQEA
jgi:hypothetical protein